VSAALGNANTNFIPLNVTKNVPGVNGLSQAKFEDFVIQVQLPDDLNCIGGKPKPYVKYPD